MSASMKKQSTRALYLIAFHHLPRAQKPANTTIASTNAAFTVPIAHSFRRASQKQSATIGTILTNVA
jgi:hypothetical protein